MEQQQRLQAEVTALADLVRARDQELQSSKMVIKLRTSQIQRLEVRYSHVKWSDAEVAHRPASVCQCVCDTNQACAEQS